MIKKKILLFIVVIFVLTGCGKSNAGGETAEVSELLNEHLGIAPYVPETDYELGAVILEYHPGMEEQEPFWATVNYYDTSDDLTPPDEVMKDWKEWFKENFPDREVIYGTLYVETSVISIEIYPADRFGGMNGGEKIEIAGHEVQYSFLKEGTSGRDSSDIFMVIHFDDVSYSIRYSVQSENIEKEAKSLAEDIIKNNN